MENGHSNHEILSHLGMIYSLVWKESDGENKNRIKLLKIASFTVIILESFFLCANRDTL
jgi:hypothetical protein